jgi:hypothetical protein
MNEINNLIEQINSNPIGTRFIIIINKNYNLVIKNGSNNFTYYNNIESMVVSLRLLLKLLTYNINLNKSNFITKIFINKPIKLHNLYKIKRSKSI